MQNPQNGIIMKYKRRCIRRRCLTTAKRRLGCKRRVNETFGVGQWEKRNYGGSSKRTVVSGELQWDA
ncbi:hypothetical protein BRYFOR_08736 [Marvinbryantia formatexigens DSM 14469]|uniref:Uncharacterized protein n=1 Tax=Marvinbryantia formatexigens DSM 14469 TaxID=478749 RepID=C6LJA1_9FIRM|nr:hypothetical protein BRYFOR_08736 [Marvinbryantia formatexigens DSM 14469]